MSMRISSAAALLSLAACGQAAPPPGMAIECVVDGAPAECRMEIVASQGGEALRLWHPDGGFRRLSIGRDGYSLRAVGAGEVDQQLDGDRLRLTIGADRYTIPANWRTGPGR